LQGPRRDESGDAQGDDARSAPPGALARRGQRRGGDGPDDPDAHGPRRRAALRVHHAARAEGGRDRRVARPGALSRPAIVVSLARRRPQLTAARPRPQHGVMEFRDLTEDERVALVALLEIVIASDRDVTREEQTEIKHVIHALGEDAYRAAVAEADRRFSSD